MNAQLTKLSIPLLRWVLGLVVVLESVQFMFSTAAAHFFAAAGLPVWLRPVLGGAEILATLLFLVPATAAVGGYFLLVVFGFAALVHVLHGQFGIEGLAVYAAVVLVCMSHAQNKIEAIHERL